MAQRIRLKSSPVPQLSSLPSMSAHQKWLLYGVLLMAFSQVHCSLLQKTPSSEKETSHSVTSPAPSAERLEIEKEIEALMKVDQINSGEYDSSNFGVL